MAYTIEIAVECASCKGVGSRIIGYENGNPIYENPCTGCGGDGKTTISRIDDTLIQQIITTQADHTTKIDFVYSKTDNIINKLNNINDKCDQIWDKVK